MTRSFDCWIEHTNRGGAAIQENAGGRSGGAGREILGAPTPTAVGLENSHKEFADDQHRKGLISTSWHSNVALQQVQHGAAHTGKNTC